VGGKEGKGPRKRFQKERVEGDPFEKEKRIKKNMRGRKERKLNLWKEEKEEISGKRK